MPLQAGRLQLIFLRRLAARFPLRNRVHHLQSTNLSANKLQGPARSASGGGGPTGIAMSRGFLRRPSARSPVSWRIGRREIAHPILFDHRAGGKAGGLWTATSKVSDFGVGQAFSIENRLKENSGRARGGGAAATRVPKSQKPATTDVQLSVFKRTTYLGFPCPTSPFLTTKGVPWGGGSRYPRFVQPVKSSCETH